MPEAEPPSAIHYLIYASHATRDMTADDLLALLQVSRRNNPRRGLTGMLLYRDGIFLQLLEGPPEELDRMMETIVRDERHERVRMLIRGELGARMFPDWSMGFRDLSGMEAGEIPGFSACLNSEGPLPAAKQDLLDVFEIVRGAGV